MKKTYLLLMLCCAMTACKKNNVDFSFSPSAPRAGQSVSFTNLSESGEEWEWTFGDGATSTTKSPTHIYKTPGTYLVSLKADKKSSWSATHELTVYDTIPTFACEESEFFIFQEYTFNAVVYNPYNYPVSYQWILPIKTPYAVITDEAKDGHSIHLYFTQAMDEAPLWLNVVLNGDTTYVRKSFKIQNKKTNALLFRTAEGDFRQRIFGERSEQWYGTTDTITRKLLDNEQDTLQVYNKKEVRLDSLKKHYAGITGFHIASRKLYYRADGLWVANLDGSNRVQIDTAACQAMTLDTKDNRIYWATQQGIWYMPFVGSENNRFVTVPTQLNSVAEVNKLTADYEEK